MPHTHHSHSGQFCNHAKDSLADVLHEMIEVKHMTTVALTEHVGRPHEHLYPDEEVDGWTSERLHKAFDDFLVEAQRLQQKYSVSHPDVQILIGFEGEWIDNDPQLAQSRIESILDQYEGSFDLWVGSLHHVHGEPIDYDDAGYARALAKSAGDEDALFCTFFDAQYQLITRMKPPVVGHFDLIRLKSSKPDQSLSERKGIWNRVERNLKSILEYGGVLEVNSSGLRKGLRDPYPKREVLQLWTSMGGCVVLSDDSHGIAQVGACYQEVLHILRSLGMNQIGVMRKTSQGQVAVERVAIATLMQHQFWTNNT